jgi:hypothetical protein
MNEINAKDILQSFLILDDADWVEVIDQLNERLSA